MSGARKRLAPASVGGGYESDQRLEDIEAVIEKRLFLGRVPENTSEDELKDVFSEFGEITEIRKPPGKTVAFVGYTTWGATNRALIASDEIVTLSGHSDGQTIVASFAERTSKVGRGGGAQYAKGHSNSRLFIGGLPVEVENDDVKDVFGAYGRIRGINLLAPKGNHRVGFVTFEVWGDALDAIESLNNAPFAEGGAPMTVILARPPKGQETSNSDGVGASGFDAKRRRIEDDNTSASWDATAVLGDVPLHQQGEYERLKVAYLVAMDGNAPVETCTELHRALLSIRCTRFVAPPRQSLTLKPDSPKWNTHDKSQGLRDRDRLFVRGLPTDCTDQELEALVKQIDYWAKDSTLLECRVLIGKCCGYVRFASQEAASEARDALDDRKVNGWDQVLRAEWAKPKGMETSGEGGYGGPRLSSRDGGGRDDDVDYYRLFVGQIDNRIQHKDEILSVFDTFGEVDEINWIKEKAVVYISYAHESDARAAMKALNGSHLPQISRAEGLNVQFAKTRKR